MHRIGSSVLDFNTTLKTYKWQLMQVVDGNPILYSTVNALYGAVVEVMLMK